MRGGESLPDRNGAAVICGYGCIRTEGRAFTGVWVNGSHGSSEYCRQSRKYTDRGPGSSQQRMSSRCTKSGVAALLSSRRGEWLDHVIHRGDTPEECPPKGWSSVNASEPRLCRIKSTPSCLLAWWRRINRAARKPNQKLPRRLKEHTQGEAGINVVPLRLLLLDRDPASCVTQHSTSLRRSTVRLAGHRSMSSEHCSPLKAETASDSHRVLKYRAWHGPRLDVQNVRCM